MAKIITHQPFDTLYFHNATSVNQSEYNSKTRELSINCEQSILDTALENYDAISYRVKLIEEQEKQYISRKIKQKAIELRDAGSDSEFLIVSEMMQVQTGLITGDVASLITNNFNELSEYKNQVVSEYRADKVNFPDKAQEWLDKDELEYQAYLDELAAIEAQKLAEEQAKLEAKQKQEAYNVRVQELIGQGVDEEQASTQAYEEIYGGE